MCCFSPPPGDPAAGGARPGAKAAVALRKLGGWESHLVVCALGMDILMVTAELGPYAKASETADSIAALSRGLNLLGHRVTVVLPKPLDLEAAGLMVARRLTPLVVPGAASATVYDGQLPSGVSVVLLESPDFPSRAGVYGEAGKDYEDNPQRFGAFARAVLALAEHRDSQGEAFDVIHCHDWPASLVAMGSGKIPTVFTVHDSSRSCTVPFKLLEECGVPADEAVRENVRLNGRANLLKGGLLSATVGSAMSPTLATQLKSAEGFGPLGQALASSEKDIYGVLGGVDYSVYNPATDTALATRYDAEGSHLKGNCKTAYCRDASLELADRPLFVAVGHWDKDTGADLLAAVAPSLLNQEATLVVAGTGGKTALRQLSSAKLKKAKNYRFLETADPADFRRLLAAADVAICPHRSQTSGFDVRVAQRYGAVPIALDAFAHRDSIVDIDTDLVTGTGVLFYEPTAEALAGAISRALVAVRSESWGALRRRVMRQDLGWERPARRFAQLYRLAARG